LLHRIIFASESVGAVGASTLSIAQILGISVRNNARDHLTSSVAFHGGHIVQAVEGERADLDRLMRRLKADPRHRGLRVLVDQPITRRAYGEPMEVCADPDGMLAYVGRPCVSELTSEDVQAIVGLREAA
jgi:hypothetical protein